MMLYASCGVQSIFAFNQTVQNASDTDYWILPAIESIDNYQNYPAQSTTNLLLARGETEHCQIIFNATVGDEYTITRLSNNPGIKFNNKERKYVQSYRDALVPCNTLKAENSLTALWFTFFADYTTVPGKYDEEILVTSKDKSFQVNVTLNIRNITLPLKPSIPSEFCVDLTKLPDNSSDEQKELWKELLLDHRMDPYFSRIIDTTTRKWENSFSPWSWNDDRTIELMKDERYNRYALPNYTLNDISLGRLTKRMEDAGLLDKCYFYIWDEPHFMAPYELIKKEAQRIHSISPNSKVLVTFSEAPRDGDHAWQLNYIYDYFKEDVQIYPMAEDLFGGDENKAEENRLKVYAPNEWWTYVCWKPEGVQPNFLMSMTGYQNRAIMWRVWKEKGSGFLYWGVNMYKSLDPFEFDISLGQNALGDGVLVYPGTLFGIKDPVVSVRMELWRDGQEDYELLHLVEQKTDRQVAESLLNEVYQTPTSFTNNQQNINSFKKEAMDLIENYDKDAAGVIIVNGNLEKIDTIKHRIVGPGNTYTHVRLPNMPVEAHILKIDLHNPHCKIKTFLANDNIEGTEKVSHACERLSSTGYDAYCGINGDFFNISGHNEFPLGAPRGGSISEGIIHREPRNIEWGFSALDANNTPILDYMKFSGSVISMANGKINKYNFDDINIPRSDCFSCDMTFYNEYAGGYTRMDQNANIGDKKKTEVFFELQAGKNWGINQSVGCKVTRILKDTDGHNLLNKGECALSGIDKAKEFLDQLTVGQNLTLKMTIKTKGGLTPEIREMIGGNTVLMKNGILDKSNTEDSYNNRVYPRTGVGASADGRWLYLMVVDGSQPHSRGVYTSEMCDILKAMGAVDVVGYDGGGSAEMIVNRIVANQPSDGVERPVGNGWLVVSTAPEDSKVAHIRFDYFNPEVERNAILKPTLMGYNQYDVLLNEQLNNIIFTCDSNLGSITSDGKLIVNGSLGYGNLTASYQGLTVSKFVYVKGVTTDITNIKQHNNPISIYPTISDDGNFFLSLDEDFSEKGIVSLYSTQGLLLKEISLENSYAGTQAVSFGHFPAGIYLLQINIGHTSYTQEVIIR